jgi:predicted ATPase
LNQQAELIHELGAGRLVVKPSARKVLLNGKSVRIGSRAFDVLLALIERRECLVSRSELMAAAWPTGKVHLETVAAFAAALRAGAAPLHLLCTSREPLHLPEEQVYRLDPLSWPDPDAAHRVALARAAPALQMFEQRARAVHRHFELTDDNLAAVIEICERVGGIPMAIELAAARLPVLGVEGLRQRLTGNLRLVSGAALPSRHALFDALETSRDTLTATQREVLEHLSVFAGSFSLNAAQAVADPSFDDAATLDEIAELAEKSLLAAEPGADGDVRFRMLEPVRELVLAHLDDAAQRPAVRNRHLAFFLTQAEQGSVELTGPRQGACLRRLRPDHDNFVAAHLACDDLPVAPNEGCAWSPRCIAIGCLRVGPISLVRPRRARSNDPAHLITPRHRRWRPAPACKRPSGMPNVARSMRRRACRQAASKLAAASTMRGRFSAKHWLSTHGSASPLEIPPALVKAPRKRSRSLYRYPASSRKPGTQRPSWHALRATCSKRSHFSTRRCVTLVRWVTVG